MKVSFISKYVESIDYLLLLASVSCALFILANYFYFADQISGKFSVQYQVILTVGMSQEDAHNILLHADSTTQGKTKA